MIGTYKAIATSIDGLKRLEKIRLNLERNGFTYTEEKIGNYLVVKASGTGRIKRHSPAKLAIGPPTLTAEQCARRLADAQQALANYKVSLRGRLKRNSEASNHFTRGGYPPSAQRKTIGAAVAKIIARHTGKVQYIVTPKSKGKKEKLGWKRAPWERNPIRYTKEDYKELDVACGHKVKRESALPKHATNLLAYIVQTKAYGIYNKYVAPEVETTPEIRETDIQTYQRLAGEVEYWQEMDRLAREGA